ncbi:carbohydrate ABC transporter permease [Lacticaseibacillus nasuensis]|uniref:ABC-type sugar transport system, permease component n=2 Tax=Lacticaseibacillus TaxID=2759736 RepID=A0A0R1JH55_9LACO|nr:sugar ABC transporter permease [Lacticaseibacillus nasuensis]KRK70396.1 ABC-type sugar transport system, permease component [Lacticaseibacillus nasuensis JCM 17158]
MELQQPAATNKEKRHFDLDKVAPYIAVAPFYILFLIFGLFPVVFSAYLAVSKWDGLGQIQYLGMDNFSRLITDMDFWLSLKNTLIIWAIGTIPMLFMALVLAFCLNLKFIKHKEFLKSVLFLPNITSVVAISILFGLIFSNFNGLANGLLGVFGLKPIKWLTEPGWVRVVIASVNIWQYTGYNMIIYLTGIIRIPGDLYEAARMDGASNPQIFWNVTIPQLKPIILFTVMMSTIGGLQIFSEAQVLVPTGATPQGGAMTIVYYLYQTAFTQHQFGYGSAIAWGLVVVIMFFSLLNWFITTKRVKGA